MSEAEEKIIKNIDSTRKAILDHGMVVLTMHGSIVFDADRAASPRRGRPPLDDSDLLRAASEKISLGAADSPHSAISQVVHERRLGGMPESHVKRLQRKWKKSWAKPT